MKRREVSAESVMHDIKVSYEEYKVDLMKLI